MTTPRLRRIERRPLVSESVQAELKSYILDHRLRSGDPLPSESELSQQLGVSRNSVREAVKSLETLGLIEARVGSGLYVGSLSLEPVLDSLVFGIASELEEFSEAIDARMYLELGMLDRIVERVSHEQLRDMRALIDEWARETENGRYPAPMDRAFHQLLSREIGNTVVTRFLDMLWDIRRRARDKGAIAEPPNSGVTFGRHLRMMEALSARDANALRDAIRGHYDGVRQEITATASATREAGSRVETTRVTVATRRVIKR